MLAATSAAASSSLLRLSSSTPLLLRCAAITTTLCWPSPIRFRPLLPQSFSPPSWRHLCAKTYSAETETSVEEKIVPEPAGERVREFKKRLRIANIKGGPDQGLEWLGRTLSVRGWVRTCRVQSSVTFIEVNDGSCLSNMQCVMNSDAEGYEQVEAGIVATGASVLIDGIIVNSQGSKQKVELKVEKLVMIGKTDTSTYPIQKKRASREFLRTIAHLRARTNTFSAVWFVLFYEIY